MQHRSLLATAAAVAGTAALAPGAAAQVRPVDAARALAAPGAVVEFASCGRPPSRIGAPLGRLCTLQTRLVDGARCFALVDVAPSGRTATRWSTCWQP